jgi:hypothetical protein
VFAKIVERKIERRLNRLQRRKRFENVFGEENDLRKIEAESCLFDSTAAVAALPN